jgi:hypothetical protein
MSTTETEIRDALAAYLRRKAPPKSGQVDADALRDEAEALCRRVRRFAPGEGFAEWWRRVTDRLDDDLPHRGWPTAREMSEACRAFSADRRPAAIEPPDPLVVMARRIRGEIEGGVPEAELFGQKAAQLLAQGLLTEADLEPWRERAYADRWDDQGQEAADQWLVEGRERHRLAEQALAEPGREARRRPTYSPGAYQNAIRRVAKARRVATPSQVEDGR